MDVKKADCERLMSRTIIECNILSTQKKYGGTAFGDCGIYDLLVRDGNDVLPPLGNEDLYTGLRSVGWDGNV